MRASSKCVCVCVCVCVYIVFLKNPMDGKTVKIAKVFKNIRKCDKNMAQTKRTGNAANGPNGGFFKIEKKGQRAHKLSLSLAFVCVYFHEIYDVLKGQLKSKYM